VSFLKGKNKAMQISDVKAKQI